MGFHRQRFHKTSQRYFTILANLFKRIFFIRKKELTSKPFLKFSHYLLVYLQDNGPQSEIILFLSFFLAGVLKTLISNQSLSAVRRRIDVSSLSENSEKIY